MADYRPAGSARPTMVTTAAVLLIIGGVLGILGGVLILSGTGAADAAGVGAMFVVLGLIATAVSALELYAGVQVLNLKERGRRMGIALAGVAAIFSLLSIGRTPVNSVIGLLINGFIIYALVQNQEYFTA